MIKGPSCVSSRSSHIIIKSLGNLRRGHAWEHEESSDEVSNITLNKVMLNYVKVLPHPRPPFTFFSPSRVSFYGEGNPFKNFPLHNRFSPGIAARHHFSIFRFFQLIFIGNFYISFGRLDGVCKWKIFSFSQFHFLGFEPAFCDSTVQLSFRTRNRLKFPFRSTRLNFLQLLSTTLEISSKSLTAIERDRMINGFVSLT